MKSSILLLMMVALLSGCQSPQHARTDIASLRPREDNASITNEFDIDIHTLATFRSHNDFTNFVRSAESLEKKWREKGMSNYCNLMFLAATGIHDVGQKLNQESSEETAQTFARLALQDGGDLSLFHQSHLFLLLFKDVECLFGSLEPATWAKIRHENSLLWFRTWQRIDRMIDKDFAMAVLPPALNFIPPDPAYPAGVAPDGIKDKAVRAQYETQLRKRADIARKYAEQHSARQDGALFKEIAEKFFITTYSRPPLDMEGLKRNLTTYVEDGAVVDRILTKVAAQTARK